MPPMNNTGINTATNETVIETIVKPISFDAIIAASMRDLPISICRMMFSSITTATSTRLRDEPNAYNFITIDGSGEDASVTFLVRSWEGARFTPGLLSRYVRSGHRWVLQEQDPGLSRVS